MVDVRHHGTRFARKVAAGMAAEASPTSRASRSTRARVIRRFHGRARRRTSHSTNIAITVPASQMKRNGATMRCIASAFVSMSVSTVSLLAAVDSLLLAEGTTLSARPPICVVGSTPPRWRIVAVISDSWATPTSLVEADASRPGP